MAMAKDSSLPAFESLPPERRTLWNSLAGLAAIAALFGIVGFFVPIVPAWGPLLVAAAAWFGARRARGIPIGGWDWPLILAVATGLAIFF